MSTLKRCIFHSPRQNRHQRRSGKDARHQPYPERQRHRPVRDQRHQRVGRRTRERDAGNWHDLERRRGDGPGQPPAKCHGKPHHDTRRNPGGRDAVAQGHEDSDQKTGKADQDDGGTRQPEDRHHVTVDTARHCPETGDPFAGRRQHSPVGRLRHQRHHQTSDQRPQVARARKDQQPAGAATCEDHAHAEHAAADDRPAHAAGRGQLARRRHVQNTDQNRNLRRQKRREERDQPDRHAPRRPRLRHFGGRGTQAEARMLRRNPENHPGQQPGCRQNRAVSPGLQKPFDHRIVLSRTT